MAKTNSGLLEFKDAQKVLIALDDATSEVKKAVVIDGDGVETDIQGVQPTGKKEITSTAEVNVADYATAQVVDADLVAGNIKKDVDILGVVGTYEAAVSDFSTAEVTINGIPTADLMLANISQTFPVDTVTSMVSITEDTTIVTAVLYKGNSVLTVVGTMAATISGNIQKMTDTVYLITGDCTIVIS